MSRSTLTNHSFPPFYACYLLKSIKTFKSTATYIGSTPNPPRRIRQHNGEITAGASKTVRNRPWVMQMIIHGFPSRLAALQFEWAWQHPYKSRHLRDDSGHALFAKQNRTLKANVLVACGMVASHPFNTWPLHVKLFTEEAVKLWNNLSQTFNLPEGFTFTVELEGVDGRSGLAGSGRTGPIDVSDGNFTDGHLKKAGKLRAAPLCTVCSQPVRDLALKPLENALCPDGRCKAVTHLACLAADFRASPSTSVDLIPRGGKCRSCRKYILWGDVIRGCYRRHAGGAVPEDDDDNNVEEELSAATENEMTDDALRHGALIPTASKKAGRGKEPVIVRGSRGRPRKTDTARKAVGPSKTTNRHYHSQAAEKTKSSDEGEYFDLDAVSSTDESDEPLALSQSLIPARKGKHKLPQIARTHLKARPRQPEAKTPPRRQAAMAVGFDESASSALRALSSLSISSPNASLEDLPSGSLNPPKLGIRQRSAPEYIEISD